jgi:hypothetical protein
MVDRSLTGRAGFVGVASDRRWSQPTGLSQQKLRLVHDELLCVQPQSHWLGCSVCSCRDVQMLKNPFTSRSAGSYPVPRSTGQSLRKPPQTPLGRPGADVSGRYRRHFQSSDRPGNRHANDRFQSTAIGQRRLEGAHSPKRSLRALRRLPAVRYDKCVRRSIGRTGVADPLQ